MQDDAKDPSGTCRDFLTKTRDTIKEAQQVMIGIDACRLSPRMDQTDEGIKEQPYKYWVPFPLARSAAITLQSPWLLIGHT